MCTGKRELRSNGGVQVDILRQPSSASFSIEGGLSGLMSIPHLLRRGTEYADIVALGRSEEHNV